MQARQKLSVTIKEGRSALYDGNGVLALEKAEEANGIATEIQDKRASRAVSRLRANALNNVHPSSPITSDLPSSYSLAGIKLHLQIETSSKKGRSFFHLLLNQIKSV